MHLVAEALMYRSIVFWKVQLSYQGKVSQCYFQSFLCATLAIKSKQLLHLFEQQITNWHNRMSQANTELSVGRPKLPTAVVW